MELVRPTNDPAEGASLLVQPFPKLPPRVALAYRELDIAANGTDDQLRALGDTSALPRPWIPSTCTDPAMRTDLWTWLEAVVVWINHEYVYDPADTIPSCWPQHPHLVNEIAVLADQRRSAQRAVTSNDLEEWHRYALPYFVERMKARIKAHCDRAHATDWPARARFNRHLGTGESEARSRAYAGDVDRVTAAQEPLDEQLLDPGPPLRLVDTQTGEVLD